jgi:hypothetical protein
MAAMASQMNRLTTYNPARFEYPYGVGLLDDLHNVLPEVLYDSQMFAAQPFVNLLQHRVETLFEPEYARAKANYRLFQLESRRREAGIPLPANLVRGVRGPAAAAPAPPINRMRFRTTAPSVIQMPLNAFFGGGSGGSGSGSSSTSADGYSMSSMYSFLSDFFNILGTSGDAAATGADEDDPQIPTSGQIATATLLTSVEPADDVCCAICQDHSPPAGTPRRNTGWRIIHHCSHRFHAECINQWFQRSPLCPVCRYDIRMPEGGSSASTTNTGTNSRR